MVKKFLIAALALPHTTLSQRGSDRLFVSLDRARVSLALLPLFSGRVEAGTASLYGLRASIARRADGTSNIDDFTAGPKPKPSIEEGPSPYAGRTVPQFELGGIELIDAQLIYRDEHSHNTVTVSKLNLKAGRLATRASTPIDLSASVAATEPQADLDLSFKGTVDVDLSQHTFGARGLDAHAHGHVGDNKLDVTLSLDNLAQAGDTLSAGKLALDLNVEQGPQKLSAHLTSPLQIGRSAQSVELARLAGELNLQSPGLPAKSLKVGLDGSLHVDVKAQNVASRLVARFDETTASSRIAVQGFASPHIGFDVDLDRLNLDRYLPAAQAGASPTGAAPAAGAASHAGAADPKVDLSALKALNLAGEVRIGALQVHNAKAGKLKVGVHALAGHLELAPLSASLYEGALNGSAKVDAAANRVGVNATLEGISIGPLLKDLNGQDVLEGHGQAKLDVTTQGPTVGAMRRALGGSASLALRDGAVRGINIAQRLRELKSALSGGSSQTQAASSTEKTDFSELSASFSIKNGVATNNDLAVKSPLLRLGGAGTIDIGASSIDYTAKASVVESLAGQGGGDLAGLRGVTVPVHLSGPFTALSYQLDLNAVAVQVLKNKAADQVKNLLGNKQGGTAPGSNLGDVLKGLLRK